MNGLKKFRSKVKKIVNLNKQFFMTLLKVHEGPHAYDFDYLVLSRMPLNWKLGFLCLGESKFFDNLSFKPKIHIFIQTFYVLILSLSRMGEVCIQISKVIYGKSKYRLLKIPSFSSFDTILTLTQLFIRRPHTQNTILNCLPTDRSCGNVLRISDNYFFHND